MGIEERREAPVAENSEVVSGQSLRSLRPDVAACRDAVRRFESGRVSRNTNSRNTNSRNTDRRNTNRKRLPIGEITLEKKPDSSLSSQCEPDTVLLSQKADVLFALFFPRKTKLVQSTRRDTIDWKHLHISADSCSSSRKADILFAPFFPRKPSPIRPNLCWFNTEGPIDETSAY